MSQLIHPSALISPGAQLGNNVKIGPYCLIGPDVKIGDNCELKSHVVVEGHTSIDTGNIFYPFCAIGFAPQDTSYKGEPTKVVIGKNNLFREYISLNRGTMKQNGLTQIGDNGLFMAYVHFGHDVSIGNNVRVVNSCNFAGHVTVFDGAIISGGCNVSQFVTIGRGAFIGGGSAIDRDIPSFCTAYGNRIKLKGINIIGLKRQGYTKNMISEMVDFYRQMEASALSPKSFIESEEVKAEFSSNELVQEFMKFIANSEIGIPPFMS